jgi:hypothetical protein
MSTGPKIAIGTLSFFGFAFAALLLFYAVNPWLERTEIPFFGSRIRDTAWFGITALVSVFATIRLIQGKRWAWWTAVAVTVVALALAILLIVSVLHPRDEFAASEGGFGFCLALILLIPSVLSGVLLNLPSVRRRFLS